ncbi:MAG: ATP-dependent DNA ligase, partial [Candidatus Aenigmatarchaeota archaeon]
NKRQRTLQSQKLTVGKVYDNLRKLPEVTGTGSQDRKKDLIKELLVSASPKEARYVVRTALGEMRIGVGEGTVRDSIAKAFDVEAEDVEYAHNLLTDYGDVSRISKVEGEGGLKEVDLELGRPFKVILAENAPTLEEALENAEDPAIEYKYDGMRTQIHKDGDEVTVFTRRLENVTHQFPDLVRMVKESIDTDKCIIEGEAVGLSSDGKELVPFQKLSRRVHRKYDIEEMINKIPVRLELFDVVYAEGKNLMDKSQRDRRGELEEIVKESDEVRLAKQLVTDDLEKAQKFYKEALDAGQEGLMIKNLNAEYKPGKRVDIGIK